MAAKGHLLCMTSRWYVWFFLNRGCDVFESHLPLKTCHQEPCAHEYHHLVYNESIHRVFLVHCFFMSLLRKSEQFAETVFPKYTSYIFVHFHQKRKKKRFGIILRKTATRLIKIKDILIYDGSIKVFSSSSGYHISKQIMKSFVNNNPDTTIKESTLMPANMILREAITERNLKLLEQI